MAAEHTTFPSDLPAPKDGGEMDHLRAAHATLPSVTLTSTRNGEKVDVTRLDGLVILFVYPRTGAPGEDVPKEWDSIPGARGCTPQACAYRDLHAQLRSAGADAVYGVSTQSTSYQSEAAERLALPYALLSDSDYELLETAKLPYFEYQDRKVLRRAAFALHRGEVLKVWYPVFPPDKNAGEVLKWLEERKKEDTETEKAPQRPKFFTLGSFHDI